MGQTPLVSVVDDDESVRESLPDLLRQFGFAAEAFPSAEAFLASDVVSKTSCLLLDVAMPGMSGPELQEELIRQGETIPIVFITAHGDSTVRPCLLARGAVECLPKPFSEVALLDALNAALPALEDFVLPGGSRAAAAAHLARTVCRRAERSLVALSRSEPVPPLLMQYLNRLSDLLFVSARALNRHAGRDDVLWEQGKSRKE